MISRLEHGYGRSHRVDDSHSLMTEDATRPARRQIALEDVQVGPADGRLVILTIASVGAVMAGFGRSSRDFFEVPT